VLAGNGSSNSTTITTSAGATIAAFNSTGLAVTGALSATGLFSLTGGSLSQIASFNSTNPNGIYQTFNTNGTAIGDIGSGFQTITGSSSDFGITSRGGNLVFGTGSTLRATLSSTGLAVTGLSSATAGFSTTGTLATASASKASLDYFSGAARLIAWGPNTGTAGTVQIATVSSDASVYDTVATISTSGLAVTGALSSTGALAIGNTVNTVSPTSPNRTITMVIGGTTYYIHAKTTND
jgi:hypothetical protein